MTTEPSGWVRVSHELIQQMCDDLGYTVEFHDDHTATVTAPNLRSTRVESTTKSDAPATSAVCAALVPGRVARPQGGPAQ